MLVWDRRHNIVSAVSLAPGRQLAHYEIVESIGAGGMGEVYRARDTRLGREVALKFIAPSYRGDPERRARLLKEARAASAFSCEKYARRNGTCAD